MGRLTTGQVAQKLNVSTYTIKRWYKFWENLENTDIKKLNELCQNGMPALPKCEIIGNRGDRIWNEDDLPMLIEFKNWVPHNRNGVFTGYITKNNKYEKE